MLIYEKKNGHSVDLTASISDPFYMDDYPEEMVTITVEVNGKKITKTVHKENAFGYRRAYVAGIMDAMEKLCGKN